MIERGERVAHVETLAVLSEALSVTLSELFAGTMGDQAEPNTEELLRPLSDFVRSRNLSSGDIERLLGVARAMFNTPAPAP